MDLLAPTETNRHLGQLGGMAWQLLDLDVDVRGTAGRYGGRVSNKGEEESAWSRLSCEWVYGYAEAGYCLDWNGHCEYRASERASQPASQPSEAK